MQFSSTAISALLLLFVAQACHADFQCYVCEDCATITADTPQLPCDAEFFTGGGTTMPATQTTTDAPIPTTLTTKEDVPTTTPSEVDTTTTPMPDPTTTDPPTTTTPGPPTPSTVGPVETVPTPPTPGTPVTVANFQRTLPAANTTAAMPTLQRRRRQAADAVTYHCYSMKVDVNGTWQTQRGCSRVATMEDVCVQLETANNATKINSCRPCTKTLCNGSASAVLSLVTLLLGLVATGLLHRD